MARGAPGGRPAPAARDHRQVPRAGHLHEDRTGLEPVADRAPRRRRQPCRRRGTLAGELGGVECEHPRRPRPGRRPVRDDLTGPPALDERLRLHGPSVRTDEESAPLELGAQCQHLADVRVRRPRLGVQTVAVVPAHDEAEVRHRRERRGTCADDHLCATAQRRQERPVPDCRSVVRHEPDRTLRPRGRPARHAHRSEGLEDAVHVPGVRDHHERPAAAEHARADGLRHGVGPALPRRTRQCGPHRPRCGTGSEVLQERGSATVRGPRRRSRCRDQRLGGSGGRLRLDPGMPRRHREPQHVDERAGPPVRHRAGQPCDGGREHGQVGHDPPQRHELALVLGRVHALEHVAVDVLPAESHLDARPGSGAVRQARGNRVLERPVEVCGRQVDRDPRHGQVLREGLAARGRADPSACLRCGQPVEHQLLAAVRHLHAPITPSTTGPARRSAGAISRPRTAGRPPGPCAPT
ncbi:hypothetical protein ACVW07_000412 [Cellulomonas sp. URHB0016]